MADSTLKVGLMRRTYIETRTYNETDYECCVLESSGDRPEYVFSATDSGEYIDMLPFGNTVIVNAGDAGLIQWDGGENLDNISYKTGEPEAIVPMGNLGVAFLPVGDDDADVLCLIAEDLEETPNLYYYDGSTWTQVTDEEIPDILDTGRMEAEVQFVTSVKYWDMSL